MLDLVLPTTFTGLVVAMFCVDNVICVEHSGVGLSRWHNSSNFLAASSTLGSLPSLSQSSMSLISDSSSSGLAGRIFPKSL